uniref:TGF-beta propeptide domain-containing protein n=1 Tax=Knipowitschia caucasica TaxID=637954 RepID=A0AAV2MPH5_KNICA
MQPIMSLIRTEHSQSSSSQTQHKHIRHEWNGPHHSQATLSPEPLPARPALQKVFTRINTAGHTRPTSDRRFRAKTSLMASTWVSESGTVFSSKLVLLLLVAVLLQGPLRSHGSPILSTRQRQRPDPGLGDGHGGVVDLSKLEQDGAVNVQLLESLKEQFLKTFNLSGPQSSAAEDSSREEPPEYMMELYNRFANDHNAMPTANIIRSFKNEDPSPSVADAGGVRRHKLFFNVSVPHHERVMAAELRLYTLVQTDRHLYAGVDRKVTILELESNAEGSNATEGSQERLDGAGDMRLTELASRQVFGTDNGWEAFDLTVAVQRWRNSEQGTTHTLEVHIASVTRGENIPEMKNDCDNAIIQDMKIDTSPEEKHKPLLIVFSDDQSNDRREDKRDLNEMIDHETSDTVLQNEIWNDLEKDKDAFEGEKAEPDEEDLIQMRVFLCTYLRPNNHQHFMGLRRADSKAWIVPMLLLEQGYRPLCFPFTCLRSPGSDSEGLKDLHWKFEFFEMDATLYDDANH